VELFEGLIDKKIMKVLGLFLSDPEGYYHINKVSKESKVPLATSFRIINLLSENNLITPINISKFKIYKLANNEKTRKLRKLM
jgi:hypothetical protein